MAAQLDILVYSNFDTSEALTYAEQTLPFYTEVVGTNELLQGTIKDVGALRQEIIGITNRDAASPHTPVVRDWDQGREDGVSSVKSHFESKIKRARNNQQAALAASKLLDLVNLKCPDFLHENDLDQTKNIDALKCEMVKTENAELAAVAGAADIFEEIFTCNENYKVAVNTRNSGSAQESPRTHQVRRQMLKLVNILHLSMLELVRQKPGVYDALVLKINSVNTEISARVKARLTRETTAKEKSAAPQSAEQTV